ncbi:MAG: excisionase family DNA-binding protein [Elusimicrobia bacterium]|nr:excisionase family DNA-binding protein [Elusimicrobiota bacterium]
MNNKEIKMNDNVLSTGQAAQVCSVTRDTVLKWIKLGKIEALQTPGGHYRVKRKSLKPYASDSRIIQAPKAGDNFAVFCWEYHSQDGKIKLNCRECLVFKSQAQKCFFMAGLDGKAGRTGIHCQDNCHDVEKHL